MFLETETLSEALSFAKCKDLPKKFNPELGLTWILAIALIKKKNLMNAYAIVEQRADGLIQYKKTFGRLSPSRGVSNDTIFRALIPHSRTLAAASAAPQN